MFECIIYAYVIFINTYEMVVIMAMKDQSPILHNRNEIQTQ
jgi:hypothetical protein